MRAVAKQHSDVTERLQTQTVNSTLWVACHRRQPPRESRNTWLSPPSAPLPPLRHHCKPRRHPPTPASHSIPVMCRLVWRWDGFKRRLERRTRGGLLHLLRLRSGHMQTTLYLQKREKCTVTQKGSFNIKKEREAVYPHQLSEVQWLSPVKRKTCCVTLQSPVL